MMPASNKSKGTCMTTGPLDVCKTPSPGGPIPLPYPNIGMTSQAKGSTCSKKVKIGGSPTVRKGTEISMSSGDEPGTAGGGIISSKFKGPIKFKMGASKVKAEGKKIAFVSCMTGQNGSNANTVGMQTVPSQTKVTVMP